MVDDHEVVRQGIRNMLQQAEEVLVVGEAADGEAAIEQILAIHPDVVLMDIQMPNLDGVETVGKLRQLGIATPVILLSVYSKDEYIFDGLRAGARGYLMKDGANSDRRGRGTERTSA
jgi:DNA-binding NarL/FixJ family response regulator